MKLACIIGAVICFTIGSFQKLAGSDINWTNAGLACLSLSLIV